MSVQKKKVTHTHEINFTAGFGAEGGTEPEPVCGGVFDSSCESQNIFSSQ